MKDYLVTFTRTYHPMFHLPPETHPGDVPMSAADADAIRARMLDPDLRVDDADAVVLHERGGWTLRFWRSKGVGWLSRESKESPQMHPGAPFSDFDRQDMFLTVPDFGTWDATGRDVTYKDLPVGFDAVRSVYEGATGRRGVYQEWVVTTVDLGRRAVVVTRPDHLRGVDDVRSWARGVFASVPWVAATPGEGPRVYVAGAVPGTAELVASDGTVERVSAFSSDAPAGWGPWSAETLAELAASPVVVTMRAGPWSAVSVPGRGRGSAVVISTDAEVLIDPYGYVERAMAGAASELGWWMGSQIPVLVQRDAGVYRYAAHGRGWVDAATARGIVSCLDATRWEVGDLIAFTHHPPGVYTDAARGLNNAWSIWTGDAGFPERRVSVLHRGDIDRQRVEEAYPEIVDVELLGQSLESSAPSGVLGRHRRVATLTGEYIRRVTGSDAQVVGADYDASADALRVVLESLGFEVATPETVYLDPGRVSTPSVWVGQEVWDALVSLYYAVFGDGVVRLETDAVVGMTEDAVHDLFLLLADAGVVRRTEFGAYTFAYDDPQAARDAVHRVSNEAAHRRANGPRPWEAIRVASAVYRTVISTTVEEVTEATGASPDLVADVLQAMADGGLLETRYPQSGGVTYHKTWMLAEDVTELALLLLALRPGDPLRLDQRVAAPIEEAVMGGLSAHGYLDGGRFVGRQSGGEPETGAGGLSNGGESNDVDDLPGKAQTAEEVTEVFVRVILRDLARGSLRMTPDREEPRHLTGQWRGHRLALWAEPERTPPLGILALLGESGEVEVESPELIAVWVGLYDAWLREDPAPVVQGGAAPVALCDVLRLADESIGVLPDDNPLVVEYRQVTAALWHNPVDCPASTYTKEDDCRGRGCPTCSPDTHAVYCVRCDPTVEPREYVRGEDLRLWRAAWGGRPRWLR